MNRFQITEINQKIGDFLDVSNINNYHLVNKNINKDIDNKINKYRRFLNIIKTMKVKPINNKDLNILSNVITTDYEYTKCMFYRNNSTPNFIKNCFKIKSYLNDTCSNNKIYFNFFVITIDLTKIFVIKNTQSDKIRAIKYAIIEIIKDKKSIINISKKIPEDISSEIEKIHSIQDELTEFYLSFN